MLRNASEAGKRVWWRGTLPWRTFHGYSMFPSFFPVLLLEPIPVSTLKAEEEAEGRRKERVGEGKGEGEGEQCRKAEEGSPG